MSKNQQGFDLKKVPQQQLVAFYGLAFASASSDGKIDKKELMSIYQTLDMKSLDEEHRKTVASYLIQPPKIDDCIAILADGCDELRFATVVAVAEVLAADETLTPEEDLLLTELCQKLRVSDAQKKAILNFVKEARRVQADGTPDNMAEKAMKEAAAGLAAVGIPIAAVYFSGSVIGLSAAGLTSGLAALGLGLGMVPGIGIAVALGIGVFCTVSSLFGKSKKDADAKQRADHERKAQLVIKNLQEAITMLCERISQLERDAATASANQEAIRQLTERLAALKELLGQKRNIAA